MINDGTATLLNLLPTLIIIWILSSVEVVIVFSIGENTIPIKIEPPTQIAAAIRWIHVIIACSIVTKFGKLNQILCIWILTTFFSWLKCVIVGLALQSKLLVYAAIVGLVGLLGAIVWFASLDNPDLEKVEIELTDVEVTSVNKVANSAKLTVTFLVKNPSEKTFTIPLITYELYADEEFLGLGHVSKIANSFIKLSDE